MLAPLLLLTIAGNTLAENRQTQANADNIRTLLPKSCVFSSNYQQEKQSKKLPFPLRSSGEIFFDCKKGLIWENKAPFLEKTIFTTEGEHFRLIPNEPIEQLEGLQYTHLSSLLLSILSADIARIKNRFNIDIEKNGQIKLMPKSSTIKKRLHSIAIKKNDNSEHESLDITISAQRSQITKISIHNIKDLDNIDSHGNIHHHPCLSLLEKKSNANTSCDILKNPHKYIRLNINS